MFTVNEYFEGHVKSISVNPSEGKATIGVIAAGEYEFGTSTIEIMTVVSGELQVKLHGDMEWRVFKKFESFVVPRDSKFKVSAKADPPYFCLYK